MHSLTISCTAASQYHALLHAAASSACVAHPCAREGAAQTLMPAGMPRAPCLQHPPPNSTPKFHQKANATHLARIQGKEIDQPTGPPSRLPKHSSTRTTTLVRSHVCSYMPKLAAWPQPNTNRRALHTLLPAVLTSAARANKQHCNYLAV